MFQRTFVALKPKKKQKSGAPFIKAAQTWRDKWQADRLKLVATSSKNYIEYCSSKRLTPWDSRFKPFDRNPKDGVHIAMKYMMEDKINSVNFHMKPTKKLMCNVGLLGPKFGGINTPGTARWKSMAAHRLPHNAKLMQEAGQRSKEVQASKYSF
eukprot:PhM_4_TR11895/c0_g1_i1/m.42703